MVGAGSTGASVPCLFSIPGFSEDTVPRAGEEHGASVYDVRAGVSVLGALAADTANGEVCSVTRIGLRGTRPVCESGQDGPE